MDSTRTDQGGVTPSAPAPRPIDPGVTIGHVHLRTADIDRVRGFYVDVLGFDVHGGDARRPRLGRQGRHPLRRGRRLSPPSRLQHVEVRGRPAAARRHLSDPDGNDLELCWDRPAAEWPRDAEGHFSGGFGALDVERLLAEA
jgi:catechol 2,3-dioxygenase